MLLDPKRKKKKIEYGIKTINIEFIYQVTIYMAGIVIIFKLFTHNIFWGARIKISNYKNVQVQQ